MRKAILAAMGAAVLAVSAGAATAGPAGFYQVTGVGAEDMLKMRAGPGTGYNIILGLPNGTVVRVLSCEPSGGTSWCKVYLKQARAMKGYVSEAYLKRM